MSDYNDMQFVVLKDKELVNLNEYFKSKITTDKVFVEYLTYADTYYGIKPQPHGRSFKDYPPYKIYKKLVLSEKSTPAP
jgi:hypothetical protein